MRAQKSAVGEGAQDAVALLQGKAKTLAADVAQQVPSASPADIQAALVQAAQALNEAAGKTFAQYTQSSTSNTPVSSTASAQASNVFGVMLQHKAAPETLQQVMEAELGQPPSSLRIRDLASAKELLAELGRPEVDAAFDVVIDGKVRSELKDLSALSQEVGAMPRAVDGRATQEMNNRYAREVTPRVNDLLDLADELDMSVRDFMNAPSTTDAPGLTPKAAQAFKHLQKQLKNPNVTEFHVDVATPDEAEAILRAMQQDHGITLVDTGAMWPRLIKDLVGKDRTFHWDNAFEGRGDPPVDVLKGHYWNPADQTEACYKHATQPHLQLDLGGRREVRIFLPRPKGLRDLDKTQQPKGGRR